MYGAQAPSLQFCAHIHHANDRAVPCGPTAPRCGRSHLGVRRAAPKGRSFRRSVQGRCQEAPGGAFAAPAWRPGQCVLLFDAVVFLIDRPNNIWLHRLVFQAARRNTARPDFVIPLACSSDGAQMRVTDSAFRGDGGAVRGSGAEIGCRAYYAGARACLCPRRLAADVARIACVRCAGQHVYAHVQVTAHMYRDCQLRHARSAPPHGPVAAAVPAQRLLDCSILSSRTHVAARHACCTASFLCGLAQSFSAAEQQGCLSSLADCRFEGLTVPGDGPGLLVGTEPGPVYDTAALLDRCAFRNCSNYSGAPRRGVPGGAVYGDSVSSIGLRNCTFERIVGADVGIYDGGVNVFANPRLDVYNEAAGAYQQASGMRAFSLPAFDVRRNSPWVNTTDDDPGFDAIRRSLARAERRVAAPEAEGGAGLGEGAVAGIAVACAAAALACIAALVYLALARRRRRRQGRSVASTPEGSAVVRLPSRYTGDVPVRVLRRQNTLQTLP